MPFISLIAKAIAKPMMQAISKAISQKAGGAGGMDPMKMLQGIGNISKSLGKLFNKVGDMAKMMEKQLGKMFRPSQFGGMKRPSIKDFMNFMKGYQAGRTAGRQEGFRAGFQAGQRVGQAQASQQSQGAQATEGGTARKPGESIEDFLSRILNKLIKNTEKKLEDAAKKADGKGKSDTEGTSEIQKLQNQLKELRELLQNSIKAFHDIKMGAIRHISG